ncbi:ribosomal protein S5 domain 2-type protein [Syncephalastrum racemosum]|uniref:Phosphomevalonate kinase n=1 Tax=Syncephalastrum racemosum TaxID=13706 RepID=A0A1X2HQ59_SYNRA|nr:ribosomal protein S5 domain 2-type protein [Syncephalastrum racemosum]
MTSANDITVVSAPGKVLLNGGYLVLDRAYRGLVVGTTARFYTAIQPDSSLGPGLIQVRSPQFDDATWSYNIQATDDGLKFSASTGSQNKFVETCLRYTLTVIHHKLGSIASCAQGLTITIVGDNDFYSQRAQLESRQLPNTAETLSSLPPFCKTHATLATVHKTGLGSSAALTTSLVAALLTHGTVTNHPYSDYDRTLIHNVAQFVHCFAQGKVGSGFDVSAAVWGNHQYCRFSPDVLTPIMDTDVSAEDITRILEPSNNTWDNTVVPFQLPPKFELLLGDVDAGSHTPTLVGKVLSWRKANPEESGKLWDALGEANNNVERYFRELSKIASDDPAGYEQAINTCKTLAPGKWSTVADTPILQTLVSLVDASSKVRAYLRQMSEASNVPIEPAEQTRLLDACLAIPGTVIAGVPGAGGYDAIFCFVLSEKAKSEVRKVWAAWKDMNVGPLLAQADDKGMSQVALEDVRGLSEIL